MKFDSKFWFILAVSFLTLPYVFWLVLGGDSYVLIHDNLDHEFVFIKQLLESDNVLGFNPNEKVIGAMNGIDRSFYRSGFNFTILLFSFFTPFIAYVLNHYIVHLVGFIGMYLLLKNHLNINNAVILNLAALCFGVLGYYHIQYGISISGQPLLLYAFLNLLKGKQASRSWFIVLFFPFFSFLPVTLPFYIPLLALIGISSYLKTKVIPKQFILAILVISILNLLIEFNLVYSMFLSGNVSHRVEWDKVLFENGLSLQSTFESFFNQLSMTHYHAGRMVTIPILGLLFMSIVIRKNVVTPLVRLICILILTIALWVSLNDFLVYLLGDQIGLLKTFNSKRFYFILPMLWIILLSILAEGLAKSKKAFAITSYAVLVLVLFGNLAANREFAKNLSLSKTIRDNPTFSQFYAQDLFAEIKAEVGEDYVENSNFICVGMYPNIAHYSGFKTLDSYQNNYPLAYKHYFRVIIEEELNRDDALKQYFDLWGSRCYAFSSELGMKYQWSKESGQSISELSYNYPYLKECNVDYLISSVPILQKHNTSLRFVRSFENSNSFWKLYLYELI